MRFTRLSILGYLLLGLMIAIPSAAQTAPPRGRVASPPATAEATPENSRPTTYGTSAVSYVQVSAAEFLPGNSARSYTSEHNGMGQRWGSNNGGNGVGFVAGLHLPSGARPVYLELGFADTNAAETIYASFVECDSFGTSCTQHPAAGAGPPDCLFDGYVCSGDAFSGGNGVQGGDLTPDSITVDNLNKSYVLYAATFADDGSLRIGRMIVGYVLQVSPAPGAATFNDVPTDSLQFQFVEALVAAGITAGCGGGNYCPNNPVTRGQMAVFLAKALGLQWP